jgi:DNA modification methylase
MESFARLLDALLYTPSRNAKLRLIADWLRATPDPDRGWGLAALTGTLDLNDSRLIQAIAEKTNLVVDCELAWTNLKKAVRRIYWRWNGMIRKGDDVREHPTQKPVGVMEWCIGHLPDDCMTILDPFAGSGSTGVACVKLGRRFIGIEREEKYFDIMCRRIDEAYKQPRLFTDDKPKAQQAKLAV